jgi:serine/threonine protein kinase
MKVHREPGHTLRELELYQLLAKGNVANVPTCSHHGDNYLVLSDHGRQLCTSDPSYALVDVIDALQSAHSLGLVHRDVRPANITIRDGKATLIDWGFAVTLDYGGSFAGTTSFASDHVLKSPRTYRPEDDLHSLVRSLVYLKELHGAKLCRSPEVDKLKQFWSALRVPYFYKQLADFAEQRDYNSLRQHLANTRFGEDASDDADAGEGKDGGD